MKEENKQIDQKVNGDNKNDLEFKDSQTEQTINIKYLLAENREKELKKMKEQRKKMMMLLFQRDLKNLRTALQSKKSLSPL